MKQVNDILQIAFATVNMLFAEYVIQDIFGTFTHPAPGMIMSLQYGIW